MSQRGEQAQLGEFHAEVARLAGTWNVPVGAAQDADLARFAELLLAWNARINLTAARSLEVLATEHLPDAFALAAALPRPARVIDVGSGGGLPALPLAVLRPKLTLQLVEPIAKKVAFLRTAVRELGMGARATVTMGRAEAMEPQNADVAISRAALPPAAWIAAAKRLVRTGGRIFALASTDLVLEDAEVRRMEGRSYAGGRRWLIEFERMASEPTG